MFTDTQAYVELPQEDFIIQLWGKDSYAPKEVLLNSLRMTFPTIKEAEEFANTLRKHYDYSTDWCWVGIVRAV